MSYQYVTTPNQVSISEIENSNYCLAPSRYSAFRPNTNVLFQTLNSLIKEATSKIQLKRNEKYFYSEIGDIEVNSGKVNGNLYWGIELPSQNPKTVKENDILISTVRTYRGGIGIVNCKESNHVCSPAITIIREVSPCITREYLLAVLKTNFFTEQVLGFQNRGMYPRLDKSAMDNILIPIPKDKKTINYITALTKAYNNKVQLVSQRHKTIIDIIDRELKNNQKKKLFTMEFPTINEMDLAGRLDTNLYRKEFKETVFLIKNYCNGFDTIYDLGFTLSRGQNLQVSNIGTSIYSKVYHPNFYTLMLPKFLSKYGTIDTVEYIGNPKKLKTLKKGDLIFGAEGFEKGRSIVIIEEKNRTITNIHGITIQQKAHNVEKAIFVKCCLDYLRDKGLIDLFAVGGNGGSLAQKYWEHIPFPKFGATAQANLVKLYHNNESEYNTKGWNLDNFLTNDNSFNETAGIYELDKTAKLLKTKLNSIIDNIVNDKPVKIDFA